MNTYKCDICDSKGDNYFGYNYNYGYCNNPECKETADEKNYNNQREMFDYDMENGNFGMAMEDIENGDINII
jgi:hypothetical protein